MVCCLRVISKLYHQTLYIYMYGWALKTQLWKSRQITPNHAISRGAPKDQSQHILPMEKSRQITPNHARYFLIGGHTQDIYDACIGYPLMLYTHFEQGLVSGAQTLVKACRFKIPFGISIQRRPPSIAFGSWGFCNSITSLSLRSQDPISPHIAAYGFLVYTQRLQSSSSFGCIIIHPYIRSRRRYRS